MKSKDYVALIYGLKMLHSYNLKWKYITEKKKSLAMLWIITAVFTDHLFLIKSQWYACKVIL